VIQSSDNISIGLYQFSYSFEERDLDHKVLEKVCCTYSRNGSNIFHIMRLRQSNPILSFD
jgi:hypothetical protein